MSLVGISFEQHPLDWASTQTLLIMLEAKADKEACIEQRMQLLRLASKAVKHPRLLGSQIFTKAKNLIEGFHTMDDEGFLQVLAQSNLLHENFLLYLHRRPSQSVKPAFSNRKLARKVRNGKRFVCLPRVNAPSVATINDGHNILICRNLVGMEIDITLHLRLYRQERLKSYSATMAIV